MDNYGNLIVSGRRHRAGMSCGTQRAKLERPKQERDRNLSSPLEVAKPSSFVAKKLKPTITAKPIHHV
jgi:hypothetical protein